MSRYAIADLGNASAAYATYSSTNSNPPLNSYASTAPTQLYADTAQSVTYSSTVSVDRYTVYGPDRSTASSSGSGSVQDFASTTNPSTVTNGFDTSSVYSGPVGYLNRGAAYSITQTSSGGITSNTFETPEPSTWVMLASALIGLVLLRRRVRLGRAQLS